MATQTDSHANLASRLRKPRSQATPQAHHKHDYTQPLRNTDLLEKEVPSLHVVGGKGRSRAIRGSIAASGGRAPRTNDNAGSMACANDGVRELLLPLSPARKRRKGEGVAEISHRSSA